MRASRRSRFAVATLAAALAVPLAAGTIPGTAAGESVITAMPSLRLIGVQDHATLTQPRRGGLNIDPGVYVASTSGAFELWAQRPTYRDPLIVSQVDRTRGGDVREVQALPDISVEAFTRGLPEFMRLTLTSRRGEVIDRKSVV